MVINIFTDGGCSGNPGPGAYAAIVEGHNYHAKFVGTEAQTTNNRMELLAVIVGLESLVSASSIAIQVISDSKYVVEAVSKDWLIKWQANGWLTSNKKPVKNKDLWERLLKAISTNNVTFIWTKGHNGHPENELCDQLCTEAIRNMQ